MQTPGELGSRRIGDEKGSLHRTRGYRCVVVSQSDSEGPRDPNAPLFRLAVDEGAGTPLAAASGDVAGGVADLLYSWVSQASTVVAYHVLAHGSVDPGILATEMAALDGRNGGPSTYRATPAPLRDFLDSVKSGYPIPSAAESADPAGMMGPIGVWFRRDPDGLIDAAVAAAGCLHSDASSVVLACAVAGAVAGACFGMQGRDLMLGAAETAAAALDRLGSDRWTGVHEAGAVPVRIRGLVALAGSSPVEIVAALGGDNGPRGLERAYLGLALGSARTADPVRMIEVGAMSGGSLVGSITGSIVGARAGLMRWPWRVPNENWFAEIGRRLATHNSEIRDLPVPAAVEEGMFADWSDAELI